MIIFLKVTTMIFHLGKKILGTDIAVRDFSLFYKKQYLYFILNTFYGE